jgi:GTP cyclohydrolase IA
MKSGENKFREFTIDQRKEVERIYGEFLTALGYDWQNDPNMVETPRRVTKMFIDEITVGSYCKPPKITTFPNTNRYDQMIFQGNIELKSLCSHHIMPFTGKCHIAYIPSKEGKIVGLSKLNRIVNYFMRRPQLQEQLTQQIHNYLQSELGDCLGIAVMIEAKHMCVYMRGVEDDSVMKTTKLSGVFLENTDSSKQEFFSYIQNLK